MKKFQIGAVLTVALAVGSFYTWTRLKTELAGDASADMMNEAGGDPVTDFPKKHLATERMIATSEKAAGTTAPDFETTANDGKTYRLSEMVAKGPVVLVFIKDGCPCSRSADVFLQRMHTAGRGWVPFYGVIDGGEAVAERWAEETSTVFPILADPEKKIIQTFGAENSAYVAFIGPDGAIEKLWAGYSETMLKELADRMKPWVKPGLEPFNVADAPAELYAGCAY